MHPNLWYSCTIAHSFVFYEEAVLYYSHFLKVFIKSSIINDY